ncbi:MAG: serpin family protein [Clostridia bacterium]
MKKMLPLLLILALLTGCISSLASEPSLTDDIKRDDIAPVIIADDNDQTKQITQFALDIFNELEQDKNVLISPLSIISALSMTANGADTETLAQIEDVFGADIDKLNDYLYAYNLELPSDKKYEVSLANSVWIRDDEKLIIEDEFLQSSVNYYDSQIFKLDFDDTLAKKVNNWVSDNTDGMIEQLLSENDEIDENTMLYLINALSFDAEWKNIYYDTSISEKTFNNFDGSTTDTDMMYSLENVYLEMENATGFKKYYADNAYSFVALLPNEDVDINDFVASLDGETLINTLKNYSSERVNTRLPKFSLEYETELSQMLKSLGMELAFDPFDADFTGVGRYESEIPDEGNLYISQVIHKTIIDVDEKGTKAGAITSVQMSSSTSSAQAPPKEVYLDRPFFYMIVDETYNLPLFMGTFLQAE